MTRPTAELVADMRRSAKILAGSLAGQYMLEAADRLEQMDGSLIRAKVKLSDAERQAKRDARDAAAEQSWTDRARVDGLPYGTY